MDPQPTAPAVVTVVVTSDAGPWLEEALAALGAQDYPNLSVLVIDAASAEDPTPRVAEVLTGAFIRRLPDNPGYAAAANHVLEMVQGAAFLAFCHDDVVLAPDALRQLVEEALRSNAGIVGPKLVDWDDPERLLQVGLTTDRTGFPSPLVERGELDQEQHDSVRDVFAVPGGCTLVRADLFAELGGFDGSMTRHGEDVDLCWRAQVAGARVLVVPAARVRHLEALPRRPGGDPARRRLQARHRLRSVLVCDSPVSLLIVLPIAVAAAMAEIVYAVLAGRRGQAADIADAWAWNLRHLGDVRRARRAAQKLRRTPDHDIHRLQLRGSARLTAFVRGQFGGEDRAQALAVAGRDLLGSVRRGPRRTALLVWLAVALLLIVGTRDFIGGRLPSVGQLVPFPGHAGTFVRSFLSGWRPNGLGSGTPAPTAFGLLGLGGYLLLGATGLLQRLLVVGALPLGVLGAWRLAQPLARASTRARLVAPVVYVTIPLPYDALARGRWAGLIAYAAFPFLLARLLAATGLEPFAADNRPLRGQIVGFGLLLAVVGALVPTIPLFVVVAALGLVLGSLLAGALGAAARAVPVALGGFGVAVLLCFPWVVGLLFPSAEWATIGGVGLPAARGLPLGTLLRFQTGPLGAPPIGWAFLVVAALPLFIGREWRLAWATRLWSVALVSWLLAWTAGRGWLPVALPAPEVVLAPAAVALALAAALGMVAFDVDLRGYRFGWRQGASIVAAGAVVVGVLPVLGAAVGGRWHTPRLGLAGTLSWMRDDRAKGDFRVLWIGDPEVLPVDGWRLQDGLAYGLSRGGFPDALDQWPAPSDGATRLVPDALRVATESGTTRLGHLLGPMAIRYVVIVERAAPEREGTPRRPVPDSVRDSLAAQLDLRRIESDPALVLYQNTAWAPGRALLPPGVPTGPDAALRADLSAATPVLAHERGPASFSGDVAAGRVLLSEASSGRWQLRVGGHPATRDKAFGWANVFTVERPGPGSLRYRTPFANVGLLALEVLLWAVAVRSALRHRRRRGATPVTPGPPPPGGATADPAPDHDAAPPAGAGDTLEVAP